jgi:hypothetical protein
MGPCLGTKARFLSFNRTKSRVVTGLLTVYNTLRRHLYLMGLSDSPLCRRCGAEGENSAHILCECEALASLRHVYLGSFILEPGDIKNMSGGHLELWQGNRAPMNLNGAKRAPRLRPRCIGLQGPEPNCKSTNQCTDIRTVLVSKEAVCYHIWIMRVYKL